ncbi:type III pantothenate kinase [Herbaspirillum rhizosphaerae]|uniref:type III pantothenate kinase n=1 Tax=Herbaspirillum rhizosphaerae TaxID=346179 RepID=UPI00067C0DAA|nr:type III pantothenate kinase [Herbaspirillum rhizosphaerae]
MLLLIDAGNTRVKWGVPRDDAWSAEIAGQWLHAGAVARDDVDALPQAWQGLTVTRVVVSNVAGTGMREALEANVRAACGDRIAIEWFASQAQLAGLRNFYKHPAQLGCDRFASAIGAHALFPDRALIVATCGTATTVDAVTADGAFIGGMILPGLGVMASSLALNTAQLPQIQTISEVTTPFADNTTDAIIAGCIAAQTGAIERAVVGHRAQHGDVLCVVAGGAGPLLASYLAMPCEKVDNLVLIGLHVAASV